MSVDRSGPSRKIPFLIAVSLLAFAGPGSATIAPTAPYLSVHECRYGVSEKGGHRQSILNLEIKIVSHHDAETSYRVQCFFLKRGKNGGNPTVDDTVCFDVVAPHATYIVTANPIPLAGSAGTSKTKAARKSSKFKSQSKAKTIPSLTSPSPREGYLVRILHGDCIVRESCSSHSVESLAMEDPELFEKAASGKKARFKQSRELQMKHSGQR
jgi:hypothetical protein